MKVPAASDRMMRWTENTIQDLRFALRGWRRTPGFAIAAIATLALGIGANTAIFSVVSGVLLRPLPFPHPERLAQLYETSPAEPRLPPLYVVYRDLENWRANAASFQGMATYSNYSQNLQDAAETEQVATTRAERSLFGVLGVGAMLGRTFEEGDPLDVVVVSAGFWRRHLGGDRSAIGRKITLDGQFFTVIGVMPEEFRFPYRSSRTELWTPWSIPPNLNPNIRLDAVVGRLKPGIAVEAARNELSLLSGRMAA